MSPVNLSRRYFILLAAKMLLLLVIIAKLIHLQIFNYKKFFDLAYNNKTSGIIISPKQGRILDSNLRIIADTTESWQASYIATAKSREHIDEHIKLLSKYITIENAQTLLERIKKNNGFIALPLKRDLTDQELYSLSIHFPSEQFLLIHKIHRRKYYRSPSYSNITGYVKSKRKLDHDNIYEGISGIEKAFEETLMGTPGRVNFTVDASMKSLAKSNRTTPVDGDDVILTINRNLQDYIYQLLEKESASVIVTDLEDDSIKAMVSTPGFDSNDFIDGINSKKWNQILSSPYNILSNKPMQSTYAPGSTVKPVVLLAGWENGISKNYTVDCPGYLDFAGHRFHCWSKHGKVNARKAIMQSCDIYLYKLSLEIGINNINKEARKFGFMESHVEPGIFRHREGYVPNKIPGKNWYTGQTIISSIGQGSWHSTPMEIHSMMCMIANSGRVPSFYVDKGIQKKNSVLLKKRELSKTYINVNQEDIALMNKYLYETVNTRGGTASYAMSQDSAFALSGKTGTSQVYSITKEDRVLNIANYKLPRKKRNHGLFTGYMNYQGKRKYAITVVVEHGIGSFVAVRTAKYIQNYIKNSKISI